MTFVQKSFTRTLLIALAFVVALPMLLAQEKKDDIDAYKWRVTGSWWFSHPSGSFEASTSPGQIPIDINQDFKFGDYSTFSGSVDWHFKRKHHFTIEINPLYSTNTATLTRDITFQDVTYQVGASVTADLNSLSIMPGYQYDIIRRRHGYFGIVAALNLLDTSASLSGEGSVNETTAVYKRTSSILAPLPVIGPKGRWYPMHDSDRFSLEGGIQGMYFFGYGDFLYTEGSAQIKLHKHLSLRAGYQMGTRFNLHGQANRVGLRLTQEGPTAGLEASW